MDTNDWITKPVSIRISARRAKLAKDNYLNLRSLLEKAIDEELGQCSHCGQTRPTTGKKKKR